MIDFIFETNRLIVRRWRSSDLPSLKAVYGDKEAMKWVGDGQPITDDLCAEWLIVTNRNYKNYGYLREFWGQGIATEALGGLIGYGVKSHGIGRMIATTSPQNIASHRVLLKAGMVRGTLRKNEDGSFTQIFEYTASI